MSINADNKDMTYCDPSTDMNYVKSATPNGLGYKKLILDCKHQFSDKHFEHIIVFYYL